MLVNCFMEHKVHMLAHALYFNGYMFVTDETKSNETKSNVKD